MRSELSSPDRTVDVLVIGYGCAGACAALEASAHAEVLLVDAAPAGGGTSAASHAIIYLGGGTAIQRACGFEDTPQDMANYLMSACGPDPDPTLIEPLLRSKCRAFRLAGTTRSSLQGKLLRRRPFP